MNSTGTAKPDLRKWPNDMSSKQEEKTLNVRQRQYAIAKRGDSQSVLRTGYLGPCVAFYGVNPSKGVAFMSHVDGKVSGLKAMVEQLKLHVDGDLEGFSLYITTNFTCTLRIILLFAAVYFLYAGWHSDWWLVWFIGFLGGAFLCFGSIAQIYWVASVRFHTLKVRLNNPWQFSGRVEVSIDASAKTWPSTPIKESRSQSASEALFGPAHAHYWFSEMKPVPRD